MASAPTSRYRPGCFGGGAGLCRGHYGESGAAQFGIDVAGLAAMLAEVFAQRGPGSESEAALQSLRLEELVLARACVAGNERAWEIF